MKTLMYPIAPDDDFPEMFCAIRQGSGEHWFYVPEGESASWMLFRMEVDNAKLRELVRKVLQFERAGCEGCPYASTCDVDCLYEPNCPMREDIERDMRELGVEVNG